MKQKGEKNTAGVDFEELAAVEGVKPGGALILR